jgi:hypothetical protein
MSEIEDIAHDLVALWQSPVIQGLSRADRNAAIEDTRNALIKACATVAQPAEQRLCKATVGGSSPPGGTTLAQDEIVSVDLRGGAVNELLELCRVHQMTPAEIEAQRQSWIRGMTNGCEHGVLDFEQCPKCRGWV